MSPSRRSFLIGATKAGAGAALALTALPTPSEGAGVPPAIPPAAPFDPARPATTIEELRAHWDSVTEETWRKNVSGARVFSRAYHATEELAEDAVTGTCAGLVILAMAAFHVADRRTKVLQGTTDDPGDPGRVERRAYLAELSAEGVRRIGLTRRDVLDAARVWSRSYGHPIPRRTWGEFAARGLAGFIVAGSNATRAELVRLGFDLDAPLPRPRGRRRA